MDQNVRRKLVNGHGLLFGGNRRRPNREQSRWRRLCDGRGVNI